MQEFTFSDCSHGSVVELTDAKRTHPTSNTEYIIQDNYDILHSYYEVARKRFADNVVKQAIDHFLLTGPQAPLKLSSPNIVSALSSDELNHIASEAPIVKRERSKLVKEITSLEAAKTILTRGRSSTLARTNEPVSRSQRDRLSVSYTASSSCY
jgi:hypothetical protein